jgi:hypothetical protein
MRQLPVRIRNTKEGRQLQEAPSLEKNSDIADEIKALHERLSHTQRVLSFRPLRYGLNNQA